MSRYAITLGRTTYRVTSNGPPETFLVEEYEARTGWKDAAIDAAQASKLYQAVSALRKVDNIKISEVSTSLDDIENAGARVAGLEAVAATMATAFGTFLGSGGVNLKSAFVSFGSATKTFVEVGAEQGAKYLILRLATDLARKAINTIEVHTDRAADPGNSKASRSFDANKIDELEGFLSLYLASSIAAANALNLFDIDKPWWKDIVDYALELGKAFVDAVVGNFVPVEKIESASEIQNNILFVRLKDQLDIESFVNDSIVVADLAQWLFRISNITRTEVDLSEGVTPQTFVNLGFPAATQSTDPVGGAGDKPVPLATNPVPEAGETIADAIPLAREMTHAGNIVGGQDAADVYRLNDALSGMIEVGLRYHVRDLTLELLDENGDVVVSKVVGAGSNGRLAYDVGETTHYIRIAPGADTDVPTSYTFSVAAAPQPTADFDYGNSIASAFDVPLEDDGTWSFRENSVGGDDPADWFHVIADRSGTLTVALSNVEGVASVQLHARTGPSRYEPVGAETSIAGDGTVTLNVEEGAGYFLEVRSGTPGDTVAYAIAFELGDAASDDRTGSDPGGGDGRDDGNGGTGGDGDGDGRDAPGAGTSDGDAGDIMLTSPLPVRAAIAPGDELKVLYTAANEGTEASSDIKVVTLISRDTVFTADEVTTQSTVRTLDAGASRDMSGFSFGRHTEGLTPGQWYIGVANAGTDGFDAGDVVHWAPFTVLPPPSVEGIDVSVIPDPPFSVSLSRRSDLDIEWSVLNAGTRDAQGVETRVWLSRDETLSDNDILEGSDQHYGVSSNASERGSERLSLSGVYEGGRWNVLLQTVAPGDLNPANDVTLAGTVTWYDDATGTVDYAGDYLDVSGTGVFEAGASIGLFYDVINNGTTQVDRAGVSQVAFYLSDDPDMTTADRLLGIEPTLAPRPGQLKGYFEDDVLLPDDLLPGTYWVGALLDPWNRIAEADETDNFTPAHRIEIVPTPFEGTRTSGDDVASLGSVRTFDALEGDDVVAGSNEADAIEGGGGADTIYGNGGDDVLAGGADGDMLFGGTGNDELQGGMGADQLFGGIGNDVLVGGEGADRMIGGEGADWASYTSAAGVRADLQVASVNTGEAAGDTYDGIEHLLGTNASDQLRGDQGNNVLHGRDSNDVLHGRSGNDTIFGGSGNDVIDGGQDTDAIDGGAGVDTGVLRGLDGGGFDLFRYAGATYAVDRADRSHDQFTSVEQFTAAGVTLADSAVMTIDMAGYAASYDDIATAFGTNGDGALQHYLAFGFFEKREVDFDAAQYLANWGDLTGAFGTNAAAARNHFIQSGVNEGRMAEDPLDYIASYGDLIGAFGSQDAAQLAQSGLAHYQASGQTEGRRRGIDFDPDQYLANHADVVAAFGANGDAAALHYIKFGHAEGRLADDPLAYIASYADLATAFGDLDAASIRGAGLSHYQSNGRFEGRTSDAFDVDAYLANYTDLRTAFAQADGGYDEAGATLHYIQFGLEEGRSDDLMLV